MTVEPIRIAAWSGPRNISTAMMRAWENRGDCVVSDEPLYAHYLHHTGLDHPAREDVIAAGRTDWREGVPTLITHAARPSSYSRRSGLSGRSTQPSEDWTWPLAAAMRRLGVDMVPMSSSRSWVMGNGCTER